MKKNISRRSFMKTGALAIGALAVTDVRGIRQAMAASTDRARVFFTHDISAEGLLKVYSNINRTVSGRTGIKIHTGEPHGPNIIPRDMVKALQKSIPNSNLIETNTLCIRPQATISSRWTGHGMERSPRFHYSPPRQPGFIRYANTKTLTHPGLTPPSSISKRPPGFVLLLSSAKQGRSLCPSKNNIST